MIKKLYDSIKISNQMWSKIQTIVLQNYKQVVFLLCCQSHPQKQMFYCSRTARLPQCKPNFYYLEYTISFTQNYFQGMIICSSQVLHLKAHLSIKGMTDQIRSFVKYLRNILWDCNKYFPCLRQEKGTEVYPTSLKCMKDDDKHDKNKIKKQQQQQKNPKQPHPSLLPIY